MLIFISGGVRSGKSTYAENLAISLADDATNLHYIATSMAYDAEMVARIKKHQLDRANARKTWRTWEQSTHIDELVEQFTKSDVVLVDCLTTLLGNELFTDDLWLNEQRVKQLSKRLKATFSAYKKTTKATIIVSNEIFNGGLPQKGDKGSLLYLQQLGQLHQFLTRISDEVYLVECGIVQVMKEGT